MIVMCVSWNTKKGLFINVDHVSYVTPYYMSNARPEDKPVGVEVGLSGGHIVRVDGSISDFLDEMRRAQDGK